MAATPIAELLLLPRRERLALAMDLWESLDEVGRSESLPMDRELGEELDRRWTAHPQNPTAAISWDEVRNQLGLG
jgi:putative addiction module component (TIGR02574 family)